MPTSWPVSVATVAGEACSRRRGDPEVEDLGLAVLADEDVAGLEVAVNDAALVGVLDGIADARDQLHALGDAQAAILGEFGQRRPVHEFHRDERRRRLVARMRGVDIGDARVVEVREQLGFDHESALDGAREELAPQHLERDDSRRMPLMRQMDDAGPAGPDLTDDDEVPDDGAGRLGGGVAVGRVRSERLRRLVRPEPRQQPFDLRSKAAVAAAPLVQDAGSLVHGHLRQGEEDGCRAVARVVAHAAPPSAGASVAPSASCSHARANAHSFFTVAGDKSMAAAVSSIVSPAK